MQHASKTNAALVIACVLLFFLNVLLTLLLRGLPHMRAAELTGFGVGAATMQALILLLVYGIARAVGGGRTRAGGVGIAFWTLTVLFVIDAATLSGRARPPARAPGDAAVTDAERRGLEVGSDSIRHAAFRFALPYPGPTFHSSAELQGRLDALLAGHPEMVLWALRDSARRETVIIQVTKGSKTTERLFRQFAQGVRNGIIEPGRAKVLEDTVAWNGSGGESRITAQLPGGIYANVRCVARPRAQTALVVCVQTARPHPSDLDFVPAGLTVR